MDYRSILKIAALALALAIPTVTFADSDDEDDRAKRMALAEKIKKMRALRKEMPVPPPAGLFGVYALPKKGQFVTGINYQGFRFSGLVRGSDSVSAETVVTSAPNIFFGDPMQPPTVRVVPRESKGDVIFPFINYSINEKFSLVALVPLIRKETVLETFKGPVGTTLLGTTTVKSDGVGDIKFGTLFTAFKSYDEKGERETNIILSAVLNAPTGSITQSDTILTPMNTNSKTRLPYGMQLGSGTWDLLPGIAYWGKQAAWGWGAQYVATLTLQSENDEGWRNGDKHEATAWLSYSWSPTLVNSVRLRYESQGEIKGIDPKIYGPGLGANPGNYGGTRTELILGVNWMYKPARNLGLEFVMPISQDRNGAQPDYDYGLMVSWRNAIF